MINNEKKFKERDIIKQNKHLLMMELLYLMHRKIS